MKKLLVTGASGFVGIHLFPFLKEKGYEIFPCYNSNKSNFPKDTNPVKVNLLDQEERRRLLMDIKPTHLIHLAWYVNPLDYLHSIENIDWLAASIDLYKEFFKNGGKKCISVGSCAEYNWDEPLLEENETSLKSDTLYAFAKNTTHSCLEKLSYLGNFEMVWARIFWLYGPGESSKRFIPSLISTLLGGNKFICRDPYKEIDILYVKDVAYAISCALDNNLTGSLNIASGISVSIESIVREVATILDCHHLIKFDYTDKKYEKTKASTDKLLKVPGFYFHYDRYKGLKEYIEYIKNNNQSPI